MSKPCNYVKIGYFLDCMLVSLDPLCTFWWPVAQVLEPGRYMLFQNCQYNYIDMDS